MDRPADYLEKAPVVLPVLAPQDGVLVAMETRAVGLAVLELGGGRHRAEDGIDPRVGLSQVQPLGTRLRRGEPLAYVHAADVAGAERACADLLAACTMVDNPSTDAPWAAKPCILDTLSSNQTH